MHVGGGVCAYADGCVRDVIVGRKRVQLIHKLGEREMREMKSLAYGDGIWTWVCALP